MFVYDHHYYSTHIFIQSFQCMEGDRPRAQKITTFQGKIKYPQFKNISKSLIIQEIREILWENFENFLLTRFNLISMAK